MTQPKYKLGQDVFYIGTLYRIKSIQYIEAWDTHQYSLYLPGDYEVCQFSVTEGTLEESEVEHVRNERENFIRDWLQVLSSVTTMAVINTLVGFGCEAVFHDIFAQIAAYITICSLIAHTIILNK